MLGWKEEAWGIGTDRGSGFYPVGFGGLCVEKGLKWSCMLPARARKGCLYKSRLENYPIQGSLSFVAI